MIRIFILCLFSTSLFGATWWVRPGVYSTFDPSFPAHPIPTAGVYGSQDGTSYATAWNGITSIPWPSVGSLDTIYVCGTHIYSASNDNFIFFQATIPFTNSNVIIRMDYNPDPGIVFGGCYDRYHTYTWTGPDGNGVYKSVVQWTGTPVGPTFQITNGVVVRLTQHTNTTWTDGPGCYTVVAGSFATNYVKTYTGGAPGTDIAVPTLGYAFDLNNKTNITFLNCNFISAPTFTAYNKPNYSTFTGPHHITFQGGTYVDGSYFNLYPGNDYWTFNGCEIARSPYGVYTFIDSQTRGPIFLSVSNCILHDFDTVNYRDTDGHGVGIQGGWGNVIDRNTITNCGSAIELWTSSQVMTNMTISRNFINNVHVASITGGHGVVISGDNTLSVVGNRTGISVYDNVILVTGIGSTHDYEGFAIQSNNKDPMDVVNNVSYTSLRGISISVVGTGTVLQGRWENNIISSPTDTTQYFVINGGSYGGGFALGNNLYFPVSNSSGSGFNIFPVHSWGSGNVFSNPMFVSGSPSVATNFSIQGTSPARAAGTPVITSDYLGKPFSTPPSIGAFEYIPTITNSIARVKNLHVVRTTVP